MDLERLDRICAHVEDHGIGELLPYLTFDELAHIEARGSLKQLFRRRGATASSSSSGFPQEPSWVRQQPYETQEYLHNVRKRYMAQVAAVQRGKGRLRDKKAQIEAIKQRYIAEMVNVRLELKKEEQRKQLRNSPTPYAAPADLPPAPSLAAEIGALFDYWVSCL